MRQGLQRGRHVEPAGVGVDAHGEVEQRVAHCHPGCSRRHAVLAQVGAEGVAQGMQIDGPAAVVQSYARQLTEAQAREHHGPANQHPVQAEAPEPAVLGPMDRHAVAHGDVKHFSPEPLRALAQLPQHYAYHVVAPNVNAQNVERTKTGTAFELAGIHASSSLHPAAPQRSLRMPSALVRAGPRGPRSRGAMTRKRRRR